MRQEAVGNLRDEYWIVLCVEHDLEGAVDLSYDRLRNERMNEYTTLWMSHCTCVKAADRHCNDRIE